MDAKEMERPLPEVEGLGVQQAVAIGLQEAIHGVERCEELLARVKRILDRMEGKEIVVEEHQKKGRERREARKMCIQCTRTVSGVRMACTQDTTQMCNCCKECRERCTGQLV